MSRVLLVSKHLVVTKYDLTRTAIEVRGGGNGFFGGPSSNIFIDVHIEVDTYEFLNYYDILTVDIPFTITSLGQGGVSILLYLLL